MKTRRICRNCNMDTVKSLACKRKEKILSVLFEHYQINCVNMHRLDSEKLDELIAQLDHKGVDREKIIVEMIQLFASVPDRTVIRMPVIERVKEILQQNMAEEVSVAGIARELGMSLHYLCHAFKKATGVSIKEYMHALRIDRAKELLVSSEKKIGDIAWECGFGSPSYFSKKFTASQRMSATQYRNIKKREKSRGEQYMLITDPKELLQYDAPHRVWQGIPGIEVTKKGRIFVTFYSGKTSETLGNYCLLLKSDDGVNYSKPIAAVYADEDHRCYDPCLWMDPMGRLWFFWAYAPDHGAYGVYCEDPDAEVLQWSEPIPMGKDVMMNKPTVLKNGDWLLPIAVWKRVLPVEWHQSEDTHRLAFAFRSRDQGKTFEQLGGSDVAGRTFDEHMILELPDGRLAMYVRTDYGIGVSYSDDGGCTWSEGEDTGWGGPDSRFFIRRLRSGRVLLINHWNYTGRSHLTAMLSEDEGKTWPYKLLLDERQSVSYPDAVEAPDGNIYITYDRERGCFLSSMAEVYACSREILIARITEEDILAGKLVSEGSYRKRVASKLGQYADGDPFIGK